MRTSEPLIIDAEFRVLNRSRWQHWKRRLPNPRDRLAFVLVGVGGLALLGALLLGNHADLLLDAPPGYLWDMAKAGFLAGLPLVGIGSLISTEHRGKGLACLALAVLFATTGCSDERRETPTPEEVRASIREATRYRDPREGWTPKPLPIPGVTSVDQPQEQVDEGN